MTAIDIKAIEWTEGTASATEWFVFCRLRDWFDEFGWTVSESGVPDYDASAILDNNVFAFRIAQAVVIVTVEFGADATMDTIKRVEVIPA